MNLNTIKNWNFTILCDTSIIMHEKALEKFAQIATVHVHYSFEQSCKLLLHYHKTFGNMQ